MALDINPELDIKQFPDGIHDSNLAEFFDGVDLYVDGLDFFAFPRATTFAACARLRIPAITAAPLGMGTAVLNFLPGGMTFEDYFGWGDLPEEEKALRFLVGLAPAGLHGPYLVDPSAINLERRGPSTIMGCQLCAGAAATEALKILLKRGKVLAAPHGMHFDAYRNKLVHTWRPGGNRHPLQRLAWPSSAPRAAQGHNGASTAARSHLENILDQARWAPSGDNTQPWRFEVVEPRHVVVHGFDTRSHCVYDLDGHPSQLSLGALLETMALAASSHGLRMEARRRADMPDTLPTFDAFCRQPRPAPDPLAAFPGAACSGAGSAAPPARQRKGGAGGLPSGYRCTGSRAGARAACARPMFDNARLRLTMPEAHKVHRDVIEWGALQRRPHPTRRWAWTP
jgi:hypothetical protein